jgi:Protein of unknown function (DUF1706)
MSEKTAMLQETEQAFGELRETIGGLTDEEMRRVWLGTWGVREILIHISGWHDEMAAALDRVAQGDAPYAAGAYDDYDAWNARFVEGKVGVKTAEVLTDLDRSHRRFLAAARALPEPLFAPGAAGRGALDGAGAGHYREHAEQIRQWRRS